MSITQTNRPKRSHVFFLKLALGVFVLIFAAMIFLNQMLISWQINQKQPLL